MLERSDVVNYFIRRFGYQSYLEIGVEAGVTFNSVDAPVKFAVDPRLQVPPETLHGSVFQTTSDAFFDEHLTEKFDLVFIDGLHTFEQSLRDFTRVIHRVPRTGVILIDDCNPSDYLASLRDHALSNKIKNDENYADRNWMGDVFKTVLFIREYFDNVSLAYIEGTIGVLAIWFESRLISPWFQTIEEISRCEFATFKYQLLSRLPRRTIKDIGDSIFFWDKTPLSNQR